MRSLESIRRRTGGSGSCRRRRRAWSSGSANTPRLWSRGSTSSFPAWIASRTFIPLRRRLFRFGIRLRSPRITSASRSMVFFTSRFERFFYLCFLDLMLRSRRILFCRLWIHIWRLTALRIQSTLLFNWLRLQCVVNWGRWLLTRRLRNVIRSTKKLWFVVFCLYVTIDSWMSWLVMLMWNSS